MLLITFLIIERKMWNKAVLQEERNKRQNLEGSVKLLGGKDTHDIQNLGAESSPPRFVKTVRRD